MATHNESLTVEQAGTALCACEGLKVARIAHSVDELPGQYPPFCRGCTASVRPGRRRTADYGRPRQVALQAGGQHGP